MRDQHSTLRGAGFLAAVCGLLIAAPGVHAQDYTIIDLGTLDGPISGAYGLNNFGRVAGFSVTPTADYHGFYYDGTLSDIPPLAAQFQSHAFAVNAVDEVVAMSYDLGEMHTHGLMWQGGAVTNLGNIAPRGLNDAGTVVGYVSVMETGFGWVDHAALWQAGTLFDLGTLGGHFSYVYAVDNTDRAVGMSLTANDTTPKAALWQTGVWHDLGTLGGNKSQAYDINDAGAVVGVADTAAGMPHAFLFTIDAGGNVTSRTDLGALGGDNSCAYAVNADGVVVGSSNDRAFRWEGGTLTDLNTLLPSGSDWELRQAWAINERGDMAGAGLHFGQPRAYLLKPPCPGDFNGDGVIDLSDLAQLLGHYGMTSGAQYQDGDFDGDGDVDLSDLAALLSVYGMPCP